MMCILNICLNNFFLALYFYCFRSQTKKQNISLISHEFPTGCVDTKDHPDEIVKKWKWTSKQALMTTIVAGICLCILSVTIMIMKLNEETPGHHSSKF